jgi:hypothetical protein
MPPLSDAALLFTARRASRALAERGVDLKESTREIVVDVQATLLLADLLVLPGDFVMQVFAGAPLAEAEGVASYATRHEGFKRVDYLAGYAARRNRAVSVEAKVAAYEATRREFDRHRAMFREHIGVKP